MKYLLYFLKEIHHHSGKILYFNFICMIIIGFLESIGIFLLIPLISLTGIVDFEVHTVPFLKDMNEWFTQIPETIGLIIILSVYLFLMIGQSIFKKNKQF